MGARNVSAAFVMWPHLPHGAFRLLVGMALQSLDQPSKEGRPARVYFGGEDAMVEVFGRSKRSMYDALAKLKKEGAVDVLDVGRHGHRAVYKLALDPVADAAKPANSRTRKPANSRTEACENSQVKPAKTRTPRNHEGGDEESREGNSPPQGSTCTAPVDNSEQSESPSHPATDGDGIDYDTAYEIVQTALGIEAAAQRIAQLVADGTNMTAAMIRLADELTKPQTQLRVIEGGKTA